MANFEYEILYGMVTITHNYSGDLTPTIYNFHLSDIDGLRNELHVLYVYFKSGRMEIFQSNISEEIDELHKKLLDAWAFTKG